LKHRAPMQFEAKNAISAGSFLMGLTRHDINTAMRRLI
jgi:hypothetical protein